MIAIQRFLILATAFGSAATLVAGDVFPSFVEAHFTLNVPTNTRGCQNDTTFVVGANFVYKLKGQFFTNVHDGHIQTIKEGFSGTTDESSPWKTLTELLAAYQSGYSEKKLRSLYAESSQASIDKINSNPEVVARMKALTSKITYMQVLLAVDGEDGFVAYVRCDPAGRETVTPFVFEQSGGKFLFSTTHPIDKKHLVNIDALLNSNDAAHWMRYASEDK